MFACSSFNHVHHPCPSVASVAKPPLDPAGARDMEESVERSTMESLGRRGTSLRQVTRRGDARGGSSCLAWRVVLSETGQTWLPVPRTACTPKTPAAWGKGRRRTLKVHPEVRVVSYGGTFQSWEQQCKWVCTHRCLTPVIWEISHTKQGIKQNTYTL